MGKVFVATYNPFLWLGRWMAGIFHLSPVAALLILSNLFFFLFLWELNALFNRMVTPDVATAAAVLIVLWPTSYELSLGSTMAMSCFFVALAVRHALDNQWFIGGLGLGGLALVEPMAIGLLPLILYIFWYFQRHFPIADAAKRAAFFLVPFGLAVFWRLSVYRDLGTTIHSSALMQLFSVFHGAGVGWVFSRELAGQTISLLFFAIGAVSALFSNITFVNRIIPAMLLLLVTLFSPYATLASRMPLAGACMEGIASASSRQAGRIVMFLMLVLGVYEIYAVFH
jgi:hypothetical protein